MVTKNTYINFFCFITRPLHTIRIVLRMKLLPSFDRVRFTSSLLNLLIKVNTRWPISLKLLRENVLSWKKSMNQWVVIRFCLCVEKMEQGLRGGEIGLLMNFPFIFYGKKKPDFKIICSLSLDEYKYHYMRLQMYWRYPKYRIECAC